MLKQPISAESIPVKYGQIYTEWYTVAISIQLMQFGIVIRVPWAPLQ